MENCVLIDGRDAPRAQPALAALQHRLRAADAAPVLRHVLENLRYGRPDATMDEIEAAVKAVSADRSSQDCRTASSDIGEGGNTLSTGEKQLLSFARAPLADPRIFVLDEATSSVDTVTEQLIQNAIERS
ncbi:MAG: ATP-binding cassette domain-containing protein [Christensenellales bacterium]